MVAFATFCVPLLFHLFLLSSSQVNTVVNYNVNNNNSTEPVLTTESAVLYDPTESSSSVDGGIQSTTTEGEKGVTTTVKATTTMKQEETQETDEESYEPIIAIDEVPYTEDPWDKGVTLPYTPKKGIATSTVILAAICIALLISICNVYCFGKTRGYI
uniref:Uncharacterized protein n=1 Tax=Meloidogyne enterolobii TaxID=390850 RepID=A0A6V7UEZ1_MELEN|nr:unnamed protein product [Meloidogyne enterolobii]